MAGTSLQFTAASVDGDEFPNDGRTLFIVKNGGTTAITVTVNSQKKCDQGYDHDVVVNVGTSAEIVIGPLPTDRFNNTSGRVNVTYSDVTNVTVAAVKM